MTACPRCYVSDPLRDRPRCTRPDCPAMEAAVTKHHFDIIAAHEIAEELNACDPLDIYEMEREAERDEAWIKGERRADRLHRYEGAEKAIAVNVVVGWVIILVTILAVWWGFFS